MDNSMAMFVKLMGMTTSPHDGEALNALRKANAMLAASNLTWQELLAVTSPSQPRQQPATFRDVPSEQKKHTDSKEIDRLFEQAFHRARGSFREFLESIHDWWETKKFLTERQYQALRKAARA
jgi:hypothetical protein